MLNSSWDDRQFTDRKEENLSRVWNQGLGSRRRPPGPVARLVFGIVLLVVAGVGIGPAVSAARGHGVRGYFVAQAENCGRHGCSWSGLFTLPGGQVTRSGVDFFGDESGMHAGSTVPALDSGALTGVFPRHGNDGWLEYPVMGTVGTALIAQSIWALVRRRRRASSVTADSERS